MVCPAQELGPEGAFILTDSRGLAILWTESGSGPMGAVEKESMPIFVNRLFRAARLEAGLYEEVEADKGALRQAMTVVALSSLAAGIGTIGRTGDYGLVIAWLILSLVGWFVWALASYWIGTHIFPEPQTRSDIGELLRTLGFASAPGIICVLGVLPGVSQVIYKVAMVWMFAAMVVAVRQALDYKSTWRAIAVVFSGAFVQLMFFMLGIRVAAA